MMKSATAKSGEAKFTGFTRASNHAGGIEGGISNGAGILVRGYLKPISTLRRPLGSVDFATREPVKAAYERSDVWSSRRPALLLKPWWRLRWRAVRWKNLAAIPSLKRGKF